MLVVIRVRSCFVFCGVLQGMLCGVFGIFVCVVSWVAVPLGVAWCGVVHGVL